jgi:hypothetical protein
VRLTRLPGCRRGERLQKLLYLNPDPEPKAICTLPVRQQVLQPWLRFLGMVLPMTAGDVKDQDGWDDVLRCEAALAWYEHAPAAREPLARLRAWMGGGK